MAKLYFSADKAIEGRNRTARRERRADAIRNDPAHRRTGNRGTRGRRLESFTRGDLATLRGALETQIEHEQKTMDSLSSSDPYAMPLTEAFQECRVRRDKCEDLLKKIETIEARAEP